MTYVSCYYHAFQGAHQVKIQPRVTLRSLRSLVCVFLYFFEFRVCCVFLFNLVTTSPALFFRLRFLSSIMLKNILFSNDRQYNTYWIFWSTNLIKIHKINFSIYLNFDKGAVIKFYVLKSRGFFSFGHRGIFKLGVHFSRQSLQLQGVFLIILKSCDFEKPILINPDYHRSYFMINFRELVHTFCQLCNFSNVSIEIFRFHWLESW